MDSDSIGNRLKDVKGECDNECNAKETMEEVPKILSPEIHDVFHIFANMLDIQSFVKLAVTSKDMFKRCMGNKAVRISVDEGSFEANNNNGSYELILNSIVASPSCINSYTDSLRKLPCKVNLNSATMRLTRNADFDVINDTHGYLKGIGTKSIEELDLYLDDNFMDWDPLIPFIKDFGVISLTIHVRTPSVTLLQALRSILQTNLKKLCCHSQIPVDFILEIDSTIQEISFPDIDNISKEELVEFFSKIQSGSIQRLATNMDAVDWSEFDRLPFDHRGALPDERPLLLERDCRFAFVGVTLEFWFLHSHGGITKSVCDHDSYALEIFKCEPWELPYILRTEAEVLKDLAEKHPSVSCSIEQLKKFTASFTTASSYEKLPRCRPLLFNCHCCMVSHPHFWILDGNDNLMECRWEEDCATWKPYNPNDANMISHPLLAKYMFWKILNEVEERDFFDLYCHKINEFESWFEGCKTLDIEYLGALPNERPLVFQSTSSKKEKCSLRIVLLEDRLIECVLDAPRLFVYHCDIRNRPSTLFSTKDVLKMLEYPHNENRTLGISFDAFRDVVVLFKKSILALQKRLLISEVKETEFWYRIDGVAARKVAWKEGRLSISKEDNLHKFPPSFLQQIFRNFAEHPQKCESTLTMVLDLVHFHSCLEQFIVVPFDYYGPLKRDSPLAFVKNEIRHTCQEEGRCQCSEEFILVSFLWEDGLKVTKCSWGEKEPQKVQFDTATAGLMEVPAVLQLKEFLKNLLQAKFEKSSRFTWFGCIASLRIYLKDFVKLPFEYDGPLPQERPIFFEKRQHNKNITYFLLREDGTVIECQELGSYVSFSCSNGRDYIPLSLRGI